MLCEVKYQFANVPDDKQIYNGYIRDCPGLVRQYPSLLKVCGSYTKAFTINADEFDRCLPVAGKTLYNGDAGEKVFVFWKWNWQDSAPHASEDEDSDNGEDSDERSPSSSNSKGTYTDTDSDGEIEATLITHSIVFKCIGATNDQHSQETLAMAAQKVKKQEQVEVRLRKGFPCDCL